MIKEAFYSYFYPLIYLYKRIKVKPLHNPNWFCPILKHKCRSVCVAYRPERKETVSVQANLVMHYNEHCTYLGGKIHK